MISFGEWLKAERTTLGFTQGDLAHKAHCSVVTIRKIEANDLVNAAGRG